MKSIHDSHTHARTAQTNSACRKARLMTEGQGRFDAGYQAALVDVIELFQNHNDSAVETWLRSHIQERGI